MADNININRQTANSTYIIRDSLSMNLETRYNKSKIQETKAPVAVDFLDNTFARGFSLKRKIFNSDFTGAESIYRKGFSNQKYKG